ncbi:hypothetical protein M153_1780006503 [Pseudoloma neurophilia]|uniref:Uncharacterized protein n=1 Tax=Pseudoloma neurophilia TaxID=146866 RepID=A0A0R0LZI0_9MICR|nr:hypothetical protein M153_1780006503 [Pseudoloma neurophilia]
MFSFYDQIDQSNQLRGLPNCFLRSELQVPQYFIRHVKSYILK